MNFPLNISPAPLGCFQLWAMTAIMRVWFPAFPSVLQNTIFFNILDFVNHILNSLSSTKRETRLLIWIRELHYWKTDCLLRMEAVLKSHEFVPVSCLILCHSEILFTLRKHWHGTNLQTKCTHWDIIFNNELILILFPSQHYSFLYAEIPDGFPFWRTKDHRNLSENKIVHL